MVETKAGPELDRAVSEASGLIHEKRPGPTYADREILGMGVLGWWDGDGYVSYDPPRPSTDLNAAFSAAERVGLFGGEDNDCVFVLQKDYHGQTHLYDWIVHNGSWDEENLGHGDTPALAICAAILKLKEAQ